MRAAEARRIIERVTIENVAFVVDESVPAIVRFRLVTTVPSARPQFRNANFNAPAEVPLSIATEEFLIGLMARMWLEFHVHEVCELFKVDGQIWMDPHTEDGFIRFLEVKNLKVDGRSFGEMFQARDRW